jgi:hypothetical protein
MTCKGLQEFYNMALPLLMTVMKYSMPHLNQDLEEVNKEFSKLAFNKTSFTIMRELSTW